MHQKSENLVVGVSNPVAYCISFINYTFGSNLVARKTIFIQMKK